MVKRHCSRVCVLPCWPALLLMFTVQRVSRSADTSSSSENIALWLVTSSRVDNEIRLCQRCKSDTFCHRRVSCRLVLVHNASKSTVFNERSAIVLSEIQLQLFWVVMFLLPRTFCFWRKHVSKIWGQLWPCDLITTCKITSEFPVLETADFDH